MGWIDDALQSIEQWKAKPGMAQSAPSTQLGPRGPAPQQPVPTGGYGPSVAPQTPQGTVDKGPAWTQGPAAFGGDYERWFAALMQGFDPNSDSLKKMGAVLEKYGVKLRPNAAGSFGKIELPDGRVIDVGRSFSSGDPNKMKWQWLTGGGAGAAGAGAGAQGSSPYASGSALAPWTEQFKAPSAEQALNSPGLQYALDRAGQAIMRNRAAKGIATTGGTLRDLSENQIGIALQGYGDVYNRQMGEYGIRRDNFFDNQDRPWAKLGDLATRGRPV